MIEREREGGENEKEIHLSMSSLEHDGGGNVLLSAPKETENKNEK